MPDRAGDPSCRLVPLRVRGKLASATGRTLKPTSAMRHKQITGTVIGVKTGHTDGRTTSAAVTVR